jgi:hydroxymethylpyrimidine/phosphomethylpyrimidine kinase
MPRADLVTPTLAEAATLLGRPGVAASETEMAEQGRALLAQGARAVLMKGGHATGADAVDLLVTPSGVQRFALPRIDTPHTHGTGCTLSAAIAAGLACGIALHETVARAKHYLGVALAAGRNLGVGQGRGPVDHLAQKTL